MRLTNVNYEDDTLNLKNKTQGQYNNELWQYVKEREDIEEKLGIDLITLFKALTQGIFQTKCWQGNFPKLVKLDLNNECLFFEYMTYEDYYERVDFELKDYGKTWALTKEELEWKN